MGMEHVADLREVSVEPEPITAEHFNEWIRPHWRAMARLAGRYGSDPDDILQDALVAAWRHRRSFDPSRGSARAWLLAIVADQQRKAWRRARALLARSLSAATSRSEVPPGLGRASAGFAPDHLGVDLERALTRLTSRQRLAVDLHYYLGLPVAEAAQVMRCSEGTVKSTLADARTRLRTILGEDYR